MVREHDYGGRPGMGPIDPADHEAADWETLTAIMGTVLGRSGVRSTDEHRRACEDLDPELYSSLSYYERSVAGNEAILVEKGFLMHEEIDERARVIAERWDTA